MFNKKLKSENKKLKQELQEYKERYNILHDRIEYMPIITTNSAVLKKASPLLIQELMNFCKLLQNNMIKAHVKQRGTEAATYLEGGCDAIMNLIGELNKLKNTCQTQEKKTKKK